MRKGKIYPSVGLKKYGEHLRTNFGQSPFMFDIDGMMRVSLHEPRPSAATPTKRLLMAQSARETENPRRDMEDEVRFARVDLYDAQYLPIPSPSDLELRVKGEPATLSETDLIQSLVCASFCPFSLSGSIPNGQLIWAFPGTPISTTRWIRRNGAGLCRGNSVRETIPCFW